VFPGSPSPESLRCRVHPLVRFASPSESLETEPALLPPIVLADPRRCRAPPLGFPSSSRHQQAASTSCERPRLAMFRPRRFARPRRLTPPPALWVYFTPLPRPGFTLQGLSLPRSRTSSSLAATLLTLAPSPCNRLPDHARGVRSPSGSCSAWESDRASQAVSLRFARSPPELCLPRVLLRPPGGLWPFSLGASPPTAFAFAGPRRVAGVRPDVLLRVRLPRSRFRAFPTAPK